MSAERRRKPRPATMIGYLEQLPSVELLHRLPIPMLGVCHDSMILYANPACLAMLGYTDDTLVGQPVLRFLDIGATTTAPESFQALRESAGTLTAWRHSEGGTVKAVVSEPLLMRADDPVLLIGLTDVTEWQWTVGPSRTAHRPPRS